MLLIQRFTVNNINKAVLVDSQLSDVWIKEGSVVFKSTVKGLVMGEKSFSFMSVGRYCDTKETVHTSIPRELNKVKSGLEDWRADTIQNVGRFTLQ